MQELCCMHVDHQFRKVTSLCISPNCKDPRGLCFECAKDLHKNHPKTLLLDELGISKWLDGLKDIYIEMMRSLQTYEQDVLFTFNNLKKILQEKYNPELIIEQFSMKLLITKTDELINLKTINENLKIKLKKEIEYLNGSLSLEILKIPKQLSTHKINKSVLPFYFQRKQRTSNEKKVEKSVENIENKYGIPRTERDNQKKFIFLNPQNKQVKIKISARVQTDQE